MTKRTLVMLVVAALAVGGVAAVVASSIGSSSEPVHTLPGGRVHTGELPADESGGGSGMDGDMSGERKGSGGEGDTPSHQMDDGSTMEGMGMGGGE